MNPQVRGLMYASTTAILWGFLAIALKVALKYFDAYTIVWFRFTLAFVVLTGYYSIKQPSYLAIFKKPPCLLLLAAFLLGINYLGFMQGISYAGPGVTQVIIQVGPITLGLVGFLFFKEKANWLRGLGFAIAGLGFVFFYFQHLKEFVAQEHILNTGVLWTLTAAWTWTGYAVITKMLVKHYPAQQLNLIIYGLPALLFIPLADFSLFTQVYPWWVWLLLLFLGLNTLVAYGSLSAALKYTEANKVSIIITLNPIITFIALETMLYMDIKWFEMTPFPPLAYAGAAFVIIGAVLAIGFPKRQRN
ncbi:DMT family transporter [Marinilabiliaceae bacterium JC017]|nr:DMT family transporter [Marinilabiliaceae bacterium JC017]